MYSLKERKGNAQGMLASQGVADAPTMPEKPILAAKRRRQLHPFFFHMGPMTLCITSVLLIGLMAVLYLSQLGQAVSANQQLQQLRVQQADLRRQNQDLLYTIASERSPEYIATKAKALGLIPADPRKVQTVIVSNLQPISNQDDQNKQP